MALHCVKSVHIWSNSGQYFSAFGLNTKRYGEFFWSIYSKCGKIRTRITPNAGSVIFHAVLFFNKIGVSVCNFCLVKYKYLESKHESSVIELFGENSEWFLAAKNFTVLPHYPKKNQIPSNYPKKPTSFFIIVGNI